MIKTSEVTLVFQGYVHADSLGSGATDGLDLLYNIKKSRESYPDAAIVVSTWDSIEFPEAYNTAKKLGIDALVLSPDPGGLPNIKFGFDSPNNVNRQIMSTKSGLDAVTTPYAIKLRTDSFLTSANLIPTLTEYTQRVEQLYQTNPATALRDYSPIVVPSYFSIDPMVYEHMAYHISDWMQFAKTEVLQQYWSVELMRYEDATYFENHSHLLNNDYRSSTSIQASNQASNNPRLSIALSSRYTLQDNQNTTAVANTSDANGFTDNTFRTRLAVEQYIATNHAKKLGFAVPESYNHLTDDIIADFKRYVARHIIIASNEQTGFELPKYNWVNDDAFMALNCLQHADWYQLFVSEQPISTPDTQLLQQAQSRMQQKASLALTQKDDDNADNGNSAVNISSSANAGLNNGNDSIVSRYPVR